MSIHRAGGQKRCRPWRWGNRLLGQLVLSTLVLVAVVGMKLAFPRTLGTCQEGLGRLVGEDADFAAAFAAVGRAAGGELGLREAMGQAYVAVMGRGDKEEQDAESFPENMEALQVKLPFFSTPPLVGTVESGFGWREHPVEGGSRFHCGVDVAAREGAEICAFADGQVTVVGESTTLGKYAVVAHASDYATLYAHCSTVNVSDGQAVERGETIARVGQTGQATGPHLHFELMRGKVYLNPIYYI